MNRPDPAAIQSTAIRGDLSRFDYRVTAGIGVEGDVVLARVLDPGGIVTLIDWREHSHPVTTGTLLLGVLANRDSTTHTSGGVARAGIQVAEGTELSWLGGQSGLLGIQTWSPPRGNTIGAQACGTVQAVGLLTSTTGTINIAQLSRTPAPTSASTPVLIVCGTAAEVGKTTLACRIIYHLVHQAGLRVVAVKPTGSGGIVDSLAHRTAGSLATHDLIDCGLPTSYTQPDRFAAHITRCLHYAEEHHPDLIVCELGGDIIWGNNDTFLRLPRLAERVTAALCIASDATAALGAAAFWSSAGLDTIPLTHVPAYFRNPYTFNQRVQARLPVGTRTLTDTTDATITRLLHEILEGIPDR